MLQPVGIPEPGAPLARLLRLCRTALRLRRAGADLEALVAPPYDVIDEERRAALEAADPHNAVRLLLPRDGEREGDRYEVAAGMLAAWRASGVLRTDSTPRFYSYRMQFRDPHGVPRHTAA